MRSPMRRWLIIGVTGLVLLAALGVFGWKFLKARSDVIHVTAQFDSVAGVYEGNKVAVLGMAVGKVTKITPKGGYVEVEFTVDKNTPIPADAQAVTISTSILTDRQIELTPPYESGPKLQDHATIGLNRTRTPIEFARTLDLVNNLSGAVRGDGQGNGPLADLVNSGAAIADGNGEDMKHALGELSKALQLSDDRGTVTREQLTAIVKNTNSLFEAAAKNDDKLREFGTYVRQVSDILADENLGSGTTGKKINQVLTQLGDLLDKNRDTVKGIVSTGNTSFKTLVEFERDLAELLDVAPMTLDNIYNVIDQKNGALRVHVLTDKVLFDTQLLKEVCNMMGLRQLGCSTGTIQDFGPDFGLTYILDGLAAMGQK
jgi:virulence factor Mce-like protein